MSSREEPLLGEEPEVEERGFFASKTNIIAAIVAILVIAAIIAGVAYYLLTGSSDEPSNVLPVDYIDQLLMANISISEIANHFGNLTAYSSIVGSPGSLEIATYVATQFAAAGLTVKWYNYTVLINRPNMDGSGRKLQHLVFQPSNNTNITAQPINQSIKQNGTWVVQWNATLAEPHIPSDPASNRTDATPTFNAYSPSGDWTKSLFYGSFCTVDEFELLKKYQFNMTDKIALCRYGDNFRGLKSMIGEKYGITGVLIYSDPADDGVTLGPEYPDGPYRPKFSVQRGSATYLSLFSGDVLSPGVARVAGEDVPLEFTQDTTPVIPDTPVHPISWGDAAYLMMQLQGESATSDIFPKVDDNGLSDWQGGMRDEQGKVIPYHIGLQRGDMPVDNSTTFAETVIRLELDFSWANVTIYDVIAEIEPANYTTDTYEYVMMGNHRDAWVYGAVDPHQGTAVLVELARVFGTLLKGGWRPARGLKLASWDAEEWGLMGSTEYVEQFINDLQLWCVAYINVDVAATGQIISLAATHSLAGIARNVTKQVPDPWKMAYEGLNHTLADTWAEADSTMRVDPLGSGSDFTPFLQFAGIPSIAIEFNNATDSYGVYHSIYDSFTYDTTQMDVDHLGKLATAKYWGVLARQLVDAPLLPFDFSEYAHEISDASNRVQNQDGTKALNLSASFAYLNAATQSLIASAELFQSIYNQINASAVAPEKLLPVSNWVHQFEQKLLTPKGFIFPYRDVDWYRHVIYAPSLFGGYSAVEFPGIVDSVLGDVGINVNASKTIANRTHDADVNIRTAAYLISDAADAMTEFAISINSTILYPTV